MIVNARQMFASHSIILSNFMARIESQNLNNELGTALETQANNGYIKMKHWKYVVKKLFWAHSISRIKAASLKWNFLISIWLTITNNKATDFKLFMRISLEYKWRSRNRKQCNFGEKSCVDECGNFYQRGDGMHRKDRNEHFYKMWHICIRIAFVKLCFVEINYSRDFTIYSLHINLKYNL